MSAVESGRAPAGGVASIRALERRVGEQAAAGEAAEAELAAARERAEELLVAARERAERRAREERGEAMAAAEREEKALLWRAHEDVEELRTAVRRERDCAVEDLVKLVLPPGVGRSGRLARCWFP